MNHTRSNVKSFVKHRPRNYGSNSRSFIHEAKKLSRYIPAKAVKQRHRAMVFVKGPPKAYTSTIADSVYLPWMSSLKVQYLCLYFSKNLKAFWLPKSSNCISVCWPNLSIRIQTIKLKQQMMFFKEHQVFKQLPVFDVYLSTLLT